MTVPRLGEFHVSEIFIGDGAQQSPVRRRYARNFEITLLPAASSAFVKFTISSLTRLTDTLEASKLAVVILQLVAYASLPCVTFSYPLLSPSTGSPVSLAEDYSSRTRVILDFCRNGVPSSRPFLKEAKSGRKVERRYLEKVAGKMEGDRASYSTSNRNWQGGSYRSRGGRRRKRRRKPWGERIADWTRALIAFLFSNVGIVCLVVGYTIAGAFLFTHIEGRNSLDITGDVIRRRNVTAATLWELTSKVTTSFSLPVTFHTRSSFPSL